MTVSPTKCSAVLATALASFLCLSDGVAAQPKGGGGDRPEPTEEEIAVRARLGDTSVLMGSVQIPETVDTCGTDAGYTRLVCLIDLLKESVSDEVLENLQLEYSVAEAQNWSNLPAGAFPARPGVFLGEFSVEQRGIIKAILMEATGDADNEGFDEMVQTLNADDYIVSVSTDYGVGYASYNGIFALLGTPAETGTWQLYYGGHHFAFANTYTDGVLAGATPSFRGIEPFPRFYMNSRENMPLMQEREAFADILRSLSDEQAAAATLEGTYRDILAGPQADDAIPDVQEGISVSELSEEQQALILDAIETYVGDINAADAARYMTRYTEELPETVLGFTGTTELTEADDYIRIHGPSLWLEFSMQTNKSTGEAGNHPHSVWRDIFDDYGGNKE